MRSMLCLMALLGLSGIVVYWKFLFGNYYFVFDDIGGDTSQQYIWQYYSIVEHLKTGISVSGILPTGLEPICSNTTCLIRL